ncbi:MAG TPA: hypothetical protein VFS70_15220 [Actinomycetota bacterium]|nr:hypothetical protein [Actinomycetota bacterium]
MTDTIAGTAPAASRTHRRTPEFPIGDPVPTAWREDVLTRAKELDSLRAYLLDATPADADDSWWTAIREHLDAVKQAAEGRRGRRGQSHRMWASVTGSTIGRAMSNLDAAEANLLRVAPDSYVAGQMPSLLNHVQRHLDPGDPRRRELERLAGRLGSDQALAGAGELSAITERERNAIVGSVRAASKAALHEQLRVRSFRNVLIVTSVVMTLIAIRIAVLGFINPSVVPLCFQPERSGQTVVVCPTGQSAVLDTGQESGPADTDVDDVVKRTAGPADLLVVELIGLTAAAVAAATALRGIRGSSEPYGLPVALATLKLPMGAVTAFLGLLLMRGQFVPGLSALDTSAQILAWALVFGYAQQLFTRVVDQQAHSVLDTVRGKKTAS